MARLSNPQARPPGPRDMAFTHDPCVSAYSTIIKANPLKFLVITSRIRDPHNDNNNLTTQQHVLHPWAFSKPWKK